MEFKPFNYDEIPSNHTSPAIFVNIGVPKSVTSHPLFWLGLSLFLWLGLFTRIFRSEKVFWSCPKCTLNCFNVLVKRYMQILHRYGMSFYVVVIPQLFKMVWIFFYFLNLVHICLIIFKSRLQAGLSFHMVTSSSTRVLCCTWPWYGKNLAFTQVSIKNSKFFIIYRLIFLAIFILVSLEIFKFDRNIRMQ